MHVPGIFRQLIQGHDIKQNEMNYFSLPTRIICPLCFQFCYRLSTTEKFSQNYQRVQGAEQSIPREWTQEIVLSHPIILHLPIEPEITANSPSFLRLSAAHQVGGQVLEGFGLVRLSRPR